MLKRIYIKLLSPVLFAACFMPLLSSCSDSNEPAEPGYVTLKVSLPQDEIYDMNSPASRAGGNAGTVVGDESKIESLQFFVFNKNTSAFETYATSVGNAMWNDVDKTLRITVTQGQKKIYCLANWTNNAADGMPDASGFTTIAALENLQRTHDATKTMMPPVMTGELEKNIVGDETDLSIQLVRQIARVELAFKLSDILNTGNTANVTITGVKFLKLASASYALSRSASPSGTWGQNGFTALTTYTSALTGAASGYDATKFYLPEYYPGGSTNATVMVIKADYNGTPTYYRIVLNPAENTSYTHPAYAIERNHTYQYTITIDGIGESAEPTTRSAAMGNSANITYKLDIK